MGLRDEGEVDKLPPGNPRLGQATDPISSLDEAWFEALNGYVNNNPLSGVILPLMRQCSFGGAVHAVLLLQKCHGDLPASDIVGFLKEEPQS
jgi:hypothetical protein